MIVLASAIVVVRSRAHDRDYSTLRRDDLLTLVDTLNSDSAKIEAQIRDLERTLAELEGSSDKQKVAMEQAKHRSSVLQIVAGTVPVSGAGIELRIDDPQGRMTASLLLDAVQELRDAGAEAIEINDKYRITMGTWFGSGSDSKPGVMGETLSFPIKIEAIGDPHALDEGARFRGGIVSTIQSGDVGGNANVTRLDRVDIDSVIQVSEPAFAKPR